MSQTTLHIAEQDNVMVALRADRGRHRGRRRDRRQRRSRRPQDRDARRSRPAQTVLKYGYPIGVATRDIAPGEHVHSHNLTSTLRDDFDPSKHAAHLRKLPAPAEQRRSTASAAPTVASASATRSGSSTPSAA